MSNIYNHLYNAMRTMIANENGIKSNVISEIHYIPLYAEEQEDGSILESFFGTK